MAILSAWSSQPPTHPVKYEIDIRGIIFQTKINTFASRPQIKFSVTTSIQNALNRNTKKDYVEASSDMEQM